MRRFLAILPAASLRYRPRQLFLVDTAAGTRTLLTRQEDTEVTEVVSWAPGDLVYYLATSPGDPGSRQLHRITLATGVRECLTCATQEVGKLLKSFVSLLLYIFIKNLSCS